MAWFFFYKYKIFSYIIWRGKMGQIEEEEKKEPRAS